MGNERIIKKASDVVSAGLADGSELAELERVADKYAVRITPTVVNLVEDGDSNDPVRRQFVPSVLELDRREEESSDPIGDGAHSPVRGIVHRYPDRVLLKAIHICPVYCRYCFRREMVGPGGDKPLSDDELCAALQYISARPQIWEVILTGGDPFMLSPRRHRWIVDQLAKIEHVKIVRYHTRVPVVDPLKVTDELISAIKHDELTTYVVVHINHPRELSYEMRTACARLVDAGIPLLSQSVLLRGVNDDPQTLDRLVRLLVENRIKPYYLHQGDLAPGTSHFRVPIEKGQQLMRQLKSLVSGLCQPSYVLDIPGGFGKSPIGPNYIRNRGAVGPSQFQVEDIHGNFHDYPGGIGSEDDGEGKGNAQDSDGG